MPYKQNQTPILDSLKDLHHEYERLSEEYPLTKLAVSSLPFAGVPIAAVDTGTSLHKGDYGQAALDSLGIIPMGAAGVGAAKFLGKRAVSAMRGMDKGDTVANALRNAEEVGKVAKEQSMAGKLAETTDLANRITSAGENIAPYVSSNPYTAGDLSHPMMVAQASPMKKGGQVKRMAKGGHVKARSSKPTAQKTSASRRGDGIAQRGKTKGTMR